MSTVFELGQLATKVGGRVRGDPSLEIRGIATLDDAGPRDLAFLTNPKYRKAAQTTRAAAVLVRRGAAPSGGQTLLEVDEPYLALAQLLGLFHPVTRPPAEISPRAHVSREARLGAAVTVGSFAVVERDVELGDGAIVGAGCVVGEGATVGNATELKPGVVLYPGTHVGARCLIHAGVVLGADGFGFATVEGQHHKVPQTGRVVIEDDVEIGANSTIDRGAVGDTVVGEGSKIDNLVMLAHGVRIGRGSLFAAQSGIAGSTRVGAAAMFGGQSGAAGHLEIADGTVVAAKSAVLDDVPQRSFVAGIPAVDHRVWKRSQALVRKLPELRKELRQLRDRLAELERRLGPAPRED